MSNSKFTGPPPSDEFIEQLYAEGQEAPLPELDEQVLLAAKAQQPKARSGFRYQRWTAGLASAAVIVLAVGVFVNQPDDLLEETTAIPALERNMDKPVAPRAIETPTVSEEHIETRRERGSSASSARASIRPAEPEESLPPPTSIEQIQQSADAGDAENELKQRSDAHTRAATQKTRDNDLEWHPSPEANAETNEQAQSLDSAFGSLFQSPKPASKAEVDTETIEDELRDANQIEEVIVTGAKRSQSIEDQRCSPFENYGSYRVCLDLPNMQVRHRHCDGTYVFDDVDEAEASRKGVLFVSEGKDLRLRCVARKWKLRKVGPE